MSVSLTNNGINSLSHIYPRNIIMFFFRWSVVYVFPPSFLKFLFSSGNFASGKTGLRVIDGGKWAFRRWGRCSGSKRPTEWSSQRPRFSRGHPRGLRAATPARGRLFSPLTGSSTPLETTEIDSQQCLTPLPWSLNEAQFTF